MAEMELTGLHLLLTYECNFECDHCFVWGAPWQNGTMTLRLIRHVLHEAKTMDSIRNIYFEGGEPFLYYPIMLRGVREASGMGFEVGIVSNSYWATSEEDAIEWLTPLSGLIQDLSVSSDLYHSSEEPSEHAKNALAAAKRLDIPAGTICIAQPESTESEAAYGQLAQGESAVMYRGRAAQQLAPRAPHSPWNKFMECPYEDLRNPGRVHIDYLGNLHICQGISIGNLFETPLPEICRTYDPDTHPIIGPLLNGGPAELVKRYDIAHGEQFADACHLCDMARHELRKRFPDILKPDQMYGPSSSQGSPS
jgi:MoaA/NifB/PqqE/SkfB family radical SAM enzyme